jgi:hypothetical protein
MASVPNTTTFSLLDVKNVIGGPFDLNSCFTYSVDSNFDPAYKGYKNSLMNFRNYTEPYISCSPTSGVWHWNGTLYYGSNAVTVSYAKGTISSVTWNTGSYFSKSNVGDVYTITCNSSNTSGVNRTDQLTFHLSVGGLTAVFSVTQFFAPN